MLDLQELRTKDYTPDTHIPLLNVSPTLHTQSFPDGSNVSLHIHFLGTSWLHTACAILLQACGDDPQGLPISTEKTEKQQDSRHYWGRETMAQLHDRRRLGRYEKGGR